MPKSFWLSPCAEASKRRVLAARLEVSLKGLFLEQPWNRGYGIEDFRQWRSFFRRRASQTRRKIFCVGQPEQITFPLRGAGYQMWGTLNFDALTSHLLLYRSALTEQIANALDAQLPRKSFQTAHLAALRDARDDVYEEIAKTEHQLATWSLHEPIDWIGANAYLLGAEDHAGLLSSDSFELVHVEGIPFNTRALRLLKKLELLRNWSQLIDHAISVMVSCSKRRRHSASQFLSKIRWHLIHGCHPPDASKFALAPQFVCLGCVA